MTKVSAGKPYRYRTAQYVAYLQFESVIFSPIDLFSPPRTRSHHDIIIIKIHPMIFAVLTRRSTYRHVEIVLMDLLLSWSSEAKLLRSCMISKSHLLWIRHQFPRLKKMDTKAKTAPPTPSPLGSCPMVRQLMPPPPARVKSTTAFFLILLLHQTVQAPPMTPLSYLLTETS